MTYKNRLYETITPERFQVLRSRFDHFVEHLDKDVPVVRVFDPLRQNQLDQLAIIREVSQELQQIKEDDILKAKQAAEEASKAEAEKKSAIENGEEKEGEADTEQEEKKDETENV